MARPKLDRPKPLDYVVMIGGPLVFLAIAWFGLRAIAGGPSHESAIELLREGAVRVGMTEAEVRQAVGSPKAETQSDDGKLTYRYMRSSWDTSRRTFVEEDAYIDFDASGRVSGLAFDSRTPDPPK